MPRKPAPEKKKTSKQGQHGGAPRSGRPRRATISEKEDMEKARSLGRRSMLKVMQGWVEDLDAMEPVYYQGARVDVIQNTTARAEARRQIADRCGFRFDPDEAPSDLGRELAEVFSKMGGS